MNFGAKTHLCDGVMSALSLLMAALGLLASTFYFLIPDLLGMRLELLWDVC